MVPSRAYSCLVHSKYLLIRALHDTILNMDHYWVTSQSRKDASSTLLALEVNMYKVTQFLATSRSIHFQSSPPLTVKSVHWQDKKNPDNSSKLL